MTNFKITTTINRPVEIVDKALMNPENFPYWDRYLEKFEAISGKPGEVGSIGHLHYLQNSRSYIMEDKLIYSEPGKKYISEVTGDAISARVETTLNSNGDKTVMQISWTGTGKQIILKFFLPLFRGKLIRQSQSDLDKFKELVETRGSDFSERTDKSS